MTKKEIYLEVARIFAEYDNENVGMCDYLSKFSGRTYIFGENFPEMFPEFFLHRPDDHNERCFWNITNSERVIIMCMCAAMCE